MSEQKKPKDPRTVQLKRVRLSFAEGLVEKKAATEDSDPKHSLNILIECVGDDEKSAAHSEANKANCIAAVKAACDHQWGKPDRWKNIQEDNPKRIAFRKGERFKNDEGEVYKGYAGNWVIAAAGPKAGKFRPDLFDRHRVKLDPNSADYISRIESMFYSGVYCDAIVSFYAGDKGGAGVFCSVEAIRTHQEGEKTAGGGYQASADDWDEFDDDDDSFDSAGGSSDGAAASADDDEFG